ncbi:leucine-rich repeat neuronal protein 4 [Gymnodraco acuticeps]|uniref:Leucine-rich repeat neuronal protein 4 n=1 Tax=Gymnodraco acuticeps TaxID=8218 RepID=A0A6P8THF2_GYMAC|nr:leucine-rich repeat neuronal protein 4 [Gymnodraco acuticeps]
MMAASRDLPFPLAIVCLVLIRGYRPLPTTSQLPGTHPMSTQATRELSTESFVFREDDYPDDEVTVTPITQSKVSPHGQKTEKCKYNPCLESQTPCTELAASTGCLCPGFTLHNVHPQPPTLTSVTWNGSEVIVQWCAPYSHVTAFNVTVGGEQRQTFGKSRRKGGVGDIEHISEVCVMAVNDAGHSQGSCSMFEPRDRSLPLTAGLIGGALGFLLLLLLAVLLWRRRRQRKQQASISLHNTTETELR